MKKIHPANTKDKDQVPVKQKKVSAKKISATNEHADSEKAPVGRRFEKGYIIETPDWTYLLLIFPQNWQYHKQH